jgi:uncharacterized protein YcbK (DUF882 family)
MGFWDDIQFFQEEEFKCSHTGEVNMERDFVALLDRLRGRCNFPFHITSGYRSPLHPIEAAKFVPGTHADGIAADIAYFNSQQLYTILKYAYELGFTGIGVADSFVHVDTRAGEGVSWTY